MSNPLFDPEHRYTRRHAIGLAALGAAALAGLPGCGDDSSGASAEPVEVGEIDPESFRGQELNLFTWASYHDKPWLKEYEQLRGVKINAQLIGGVPEGFSKVQTNPDAFDLVLTTSGWVENYADADLIVPLDESAVPNLANVTPALAWRDAAEHNGNLYGIPYSWGPQPLCWLTDRLEEPTSWRSLYEPDVARRVSMVDDPTTQMPFIPIMLGFENPFELDEQQFAEMREALLDLRGQVTHVAASIEDQTNDFARGDVWTGVLYNPSTQAALAENGIELKYKIPEEGAASWSDNYSMTKAGQEKAALCYDFINYTLSVEWQARFAAVSTNTPILSLELATSDEAVKAGLDRQAFARTLLPLTEDASQVERLKLLRRVPNVEQWLELWNEFKSGL